MIPNQRTRAHATLVRAATSCGKPITAQSFDHDRRLAVTLSPDPAGSEQTLRLPLGLHGYAAIRAVDGAGNIGRPLVVKLPH